MIGLEFALIFRELGADVRLGDGGKAAAAFDEEIAAKPGGC